MVNSESTHLKMESCSSYNFWWKFVIQMSESLWLHDKLNDDDNWMNKYNRKPKGEITQFTTHVVSSTISICSFVTKLCVLIAYDNVKIRFLDQYPKIFSSEKLSSSQQHWTYLWHMWTEWERKNINQISPNFILFLWFRAYKTATIYCSLQQLVSTWDYHLVYVTSVVTFDMLCMIVIERLRVVSTTKEDFRPIFFRDLEAFSASVAMRTIWEEEQAEINRKL